MIANTEIYLTVKKDTNRLVISGELALLREFIASITERGELADIHAPDPSNAIAATVES